MRGFGNDAGAAASDRLLGDGSARTDPTGDHFDAGAQVGSEESRDRTRGGLAAQRRREGGVEVAFLASGNIGLRDAKNPDGPALIFTPGEWRAFVAGAKDGEFNRPGAQPH